jgi:aminoglycoside phosphotransferase (APT) family kinase protein
MVIGHNDAAPYNAAWADGRLVGFFDWDFAAPVTREWDLAFTAFSWVPLHARHVAAAHGFTAFEARPRRLRTFLDAYGWTGPLERFLATAARRISASVVGIQRNAEAGDPAFQSLVDRGVHTDLLAAVSELAELVDSR